MKFPPVSKAAQQRFPPLAEAALGSLGLGLIGIRAWGLGFGLTRVKKGVIRFKALGLGFGLQGAHRCLGFAALGLGYLGLIGRRAGMVPDNGIDMGEEKFIASHRDA